MKYKRLIGATVAVTLGIGTTSCSKKTETVPGKQTTCPVMKGKTINPDLYVDADGKRIYVCCPGCMVQVKADPQKYIRDMEAEGVIPEEIPADNETESNHAPGHREQQNRDA